MKLKIGSLKSPGILGIRCIVVYPVNPLKQIVTAISAFLHCRSAGLIRFLRFPGFRVVVVLRKRLKESA